MCWGSDEKFRGGGCFLLAVAELDPELEPAQPVSAEQAFLGLGGAGRLGHLHRAVGETRPGRAVDGELPLGPGDQNMVRSLLLGRYWT